MTQSTSYFTGPLFFGHRWRCSKLPRVWARMARIDCTRIVSSDGCTKPTYCYVLWDIDSYVRTFPNSNCSSISFKSTMLRACLEASQKIEVSKFRTSKIGSENAQQTDKYDIVSGGIPKHRTFELSYFPTI